MKTFWMFLLLCTCLAASLPVAGRLAGQEQVGGGTGSIAGQVLDAASGQPVPHARVLLFTPGGVPLAQTVSNSRGAFFFMGLGTGAFYELRASADGYRDATDTVRLATGPTPVFLYLQPQPAASGPLLIEPAPLEEHQVPADARKEYEKGVKRLRQADWKKSQGHFEKALALYPRYASAQAGRGTALLQQGQAEAAQQAFAEALALNENYAAPRLFLGRIHNNQQRHREAVTELEKALLLRPDSWLGHFELGRAYAALKELDRAETHSLRAHELQPRVPHVHLLRGNVCLARGDYAGAVQEIDDYLELVPRGPLAEQLRQRRAQLVEQVVVRGDPPKP